MDSNLSDKVVLYTRQNCHLCEEAQKVLGEFGIAPALVDIDKDAHLQQRFNTCVPVVEIDGRIRFRGLVDRRLLRRILRSQG